jgi:hypothetical protein
LSRTNERYFVRNSNESDFRFLVVLLLTEGKTEMAGLTIVTAPSGFSCGSLKVLPFRNFDILFISTHLLFETCLNYHAFVQDKTRKRSNV